MAKPVDYCNIALGDDLTKHVNLDKKFRSKECEKCGESNGPASRKCKTCDFVFYAKQSKKKVSLSKKWKLITEWRELLPPTRIYVQSDDHYENSTGQIVHIGYNNEFTITELGNKGFTAYSPKVGWVFIDMIFCGTRKETQITRTIPTIWIYNE